MPRYQVKTQQRRPWQRKPLAGEVDQEAGLQGVDEEIQLRQAEYPLGHIDHIHELEDEVELELDLEH